MASNDESSKPFDSIRLNVPITDAFTIPQTGADAASTIPGQPLVLEGTGDNANLPVEPTNIFRSNMIVSKNGGLIMLSQTDQALNLGNISVWDDSPRDIWNHINAAEKFKLRTKDFDLTRTVTGKSTYSGPSRRKKIYKIYVTFKCQSYMSGIKVNYATNGSNSFTGTFQDTTYYSNTKGFDAYNAGTSSNEWITVGLKPSASINNIYSIALQFSYANAGKLGKLNAVSAAGDSTVTLASSASSTDDYYNGMPIFFYSGSGQGQIRKINDYTGSSRVATLSSILTIGVNTSTTYDLGYIHSSFQINDISIVYREKSIK
tara:strand:+ start:2714 stop:3667 length:954 start_codon:yes stop_codon:yes gene_type:complete